MKRNKMIKLILAAAAVVVVLAVLIMVNRNASQSGEQLYSAGAIGIQQGSGAQQLLKADRLAELSTETFQVKFQRQVGEPIDREYTGVALTTLLEQAGVTVGEGNKVAIAARDNYTVELTAEDVLAEGNVYIVTHQDGKLLDEESGKYMLIIRHDERATRWVKQVAAISVIN